MADTVIPIGNFLREDALAFEVNDYIWIVDNISGIGNQIWSPAFYTGPLLGYHLRCRLTFGKDNIGVHFQILEGSGDHMLRWPFDHYIEVSILNHVDESKHIFVVISPNFTTLEQEQAWSKPTSGELPSRVTNGNDNLCQKSILSGPRGYYETDFSGNNRVYVKISVKGGRKSRFPAWMVQTYHFLYYLYFYRAPPTTSWLSYFGDFFTVRQNNFYMFSVEEFVGREINIPIQSNPFYTSGCGYRIQLEVRKGNEWLGVFFRLVPGKHDNQLPWPFMMKVQFSLINQVDERKSRIQIFSPDSDPEHEAMWMQPQDDKLRVCYGFSEFMELKELCGEGQNISHFLRNNRILFKVKLV